MQEKKKAKFNVIDAIVIIAIVAVIAVVVATFFGTGSGGVVSRGGESTYTIKFLCEEVPDFAASVIEVGDPIVDETKDVPLGTVTDIKLSDSRTYTTDDTGTIHVEAKPYYNCVELTATVTATDYTHGMIVNSSKYGVGHSITIRVGKAKIFGRISAIEKAE